MKFQYLSDTHLEHLKHFPKFPKIAGCENLFLLGDIGTPGTTIFNDFLQYCSSNWENVFYIAGNHCFFQTRRKKDTSPIKTMEQIIEVINTTLPPNVHFLNNSCVYLNKHTNQVVKQIESENKQDFIKLVGSTLWSDIDLTIAHNLNDYKNIYTSPSKLLTPQDTKSMFAESKKYILQELLEDIPSILLTHHGVDNICNGYYVNGHLASGYATDIPELTKYTHLLAAICGHSHSSVDTVIPGTNIKLLSNCYGYRGESQKIVKYNKEAVLEI